LEVKNLLLYFSLLTSDFSLSLLAADPPVMVETSAISPNVRLGKPMPTIWDVGKRQPGLLEGKLEFRVHLGTQEFYTYVTDDIVLHGPEQRLRFLFPAVTDSVQTPELEVDVTWIGKSGRYPLRMQILRVPFTARKTMLLAVGEQRGAHGRNEVWDDRLKSLHVESLATPAIATLLANYQDLLPLQTVITVWDANMFPQDSFGYLPYDVLAVTGEIFGGLRKQQLEAIETWVRAGGRLYIEADGLLEPSHVEFLNRLTVHETPVVRWRLDRVGKLEWPVLNDADEYPAAVDLGRVVIRHPLSEAAEVSESARRFLWDVPPGVDPVQKMMTLQVGANYRGLGMRGSGLVGNVTLSSQTRQLFDTLERTLMPSGVQLVPFWLIALLLGGLVVAIGPGEWWLLGKLKLRRFTWLTWPAATVAVTGLTVGLSNWFMSSAENSRFLQITDLGTDGRVVRSQRFELTFPSRARDVVADVQRGLWRVVPPPHDEYRMRAVAITTSNQPGRPRQTTPIGPQSEPTVQLAPPVFDGRVPNRYTATQTVPQWTPRLSHRYELPKADEAGPIDWSKIDLADLVTSLPERGGASTTIIHPISQPLIQEVSRQLQQPAFMILTHRNGGRMYGGRTPLSTTDVDKIAVMSVNQQGQISRAFVTPSDALSELVGTVTHQKPNLGTDPWTITSDRFGWSDLPILSPTGPYDFAVLVVVRNGAGWTVYRRPFRDVDVSVKKGGETL